MNEHNKDKLSVKGTFVYLKNYKQLQNNEPSSLVPIANEQVFRIGLRSSDYSVKFTMKFQDAQTEDFELGQPMAQAARGSLMPRIGATSKLDTQAISELGKLETSFRSEIERKEVKLISNALTSIKLERNKSA